MENIKIIHFLKCLSKIEINEFAKFINSPYHNYRKDVISLLRILSRFYPDFNEKNLNYQSVFKQLYPGKKFDQDVIRKLCSFLYNLGKDFLIIKRINEQKSESIISFLNSLFERKANVLFEKELVTAEKHFQNQKFEVSYFFYMKRQFETVKEHFHYEKENKIKLCENMIRGSEYLIYDFLIQSLICYHNMYFSDSGLKICDYSNTVLNSYMNNFDIRKFINDLKAVNYEVDDNVLYYSCIYDCMTNPQGIEQYRRLKEISLKNREMLTHDELSDRYTFLLNFIIKNLKDDEAYSRERFEIDKELFDLPYLINIRNFKNLMKSGYDLEEYDTVEKLIVENVNLLPLEFREQTISILYASLNYKKRCFEKALEYLKKVNFTWVPFNLDGKVLEAKIYYEQDQVELLFLLIDSFRHYLNNRKEIVARDSVFRKEHFNFLKYIEKLAKIKLDPEKTGLHKFRNEISNETMFTSKGWLTKKAEELA
jgi:hypothetical protein